MKFFMAAVTDFAPKSEELNISAKASVDNADNIPLDGSLSKEGEFESISINDDVTFVPKERWAAWVVPTIQIQIPQLPSLSALLQKRKINEKEEMVEEVMKEIELVDIKKNDESLIISERTVTERTAEIPKLCNYTPLQIVERLLIFIVFAGALSIFIAFFVRDSFAQKGVMAFLEWAKDLPYVLGGLALASIYGLALFLLLPMTPFNMAAGFLFGSYKGIAAALLGYFFGQTLTFWVSNTLFRSYIEAKLQEKEQQYKLLRAVRRALAANGFKLIVLTHLSPIFPAGMLNYFFSLSSAPFYVYTIASLLGVIPSISVMVIIGSAFKNLSTMWSGESESSGTKGTKGIIWGVCTVAITLLVLAAFAYFAKKELEKLQNEQDENSEVNDSSDQEDAEEQNTQTETDVGDEESQTQGLIPDIDRCIGGGSNGSPSPNLRRLFARQSHDNLSVDDES
eukprot:TRINITY_DN1733_c0_g1_i1.p1 TRINITY_DN1733_c0_g1~~TRINITY_DN1733_c0_g1_i1.p1  ORF type:complete len:454 (-),score=79.43 TRINITY_DN1733_c0_g1_i1:60-1421(-)